MARSHTEKWFEAVVGGGLVGVPAVIITSVLLGLLPLKSVPWFSSATSLIAMFIGLLTMWTVARRLARHSGVTCPGFCSQCGYDVRGSTADTCPECGANANRL